MLRRFVCYIKEACRCHSQPSEFLLVVVASQSTMGFSRKSPYPPLLRISIFRGRYPMEFPEIFPLPYGNSAIFPSTLWNFHLNFRLPYGISSLVFLLPYGNSSLVFSLPYGISSIFSLTLWNFQPSFFPTLWYFPQFLPYPVEFPG